MRITALLLSALAAAPAFAAPIAPAHFEELEARWKFHLSQNHKQELKDFGHGFVQGVKKTVPIALSLAPLIVKREEEKMELLKREEEKHLERRISKKAKNFWKEVGHGAEKAWDVLGPTAVELTAKHYKVLGKRDGEQHLEARAEFEVDGLEKREEMLFDLYERDLVEGEQHLERRISRKAKNFWKEVGHGAEHVFEQLGPLALQVGVHVAENRGKAA